MKKSISRYTPVPPISTTEDSANNIPSHKDDSAKTELPISTLKDSTNNIPFTKDDSARTEVANSPETSLENRSDIAQSSRKESPKSTTTMEENKVSVIKKPAVKK